MASVIIPSRGGQRGRRGLSADQAYYCFDCDRRLTIVATSDTGSIICPICSHLVLEEFETPSSPSFPPPPPWSTAASVDLESFFPTSSDVDSDFVPCDPFPQPPPPPPFFLDTQINSTSTGGQTIVNRNTDCLSPVHNYLPPPPPPPPWHSNSASDSDVRHLRIPSLPPLHPPPPVTDPSAPVPLPPPSESELGELILPLETSVTSSPPHSPPRSSDASDIFYSPSRDPGEEENPNPQPPSPQMLPPPPPPPILNHWDYFFPDISDLPDLHPNNLPNHESSSDPQRNSQANHENSSSDLLAPPPPPPWLISDLSVIKMTEELLSDWKTHQCSICIDNFAVNQIVELTPCNHIYHSDCLLRWLDLHKSCPICRRQLSSQ